jgi:hypothetical protein
VTSTSATLLVGVVLTASASPAIAQTPRPRGDAAGYIAWLAFEDERPGNVHRRRWADSLFGGLSAGWYWTDHLKTEIDAGAGTAARGFVGRTVTVDGRPAQQFIETATAHRVVAVSQQFQYFRNVWFHPHLAGGLQLTWERRTDRYQSLLLYEGPGLPPRIVHDGFVEGPDTRLRVRPFGAAGFKGYVTPRVFIRGDLRLVFRHGLEESLVRAGIGFDF